jgi:hypothetical protein
MFLTLILWLSMPEAMAQKKNQSSSLIEHKAHLEEMISQRLSSTIATTLQKDDFNVSVQVDMVEVPPKKESFPKETPKAAETERPLDLSVGLVDAESLIRKYEDDLHEARERALVLSQRAAAEVKPEFTVKSIQVFVGLKSSLGEEYAKELQDWIKKRLSSNFGPAVSVTTGLLKSAPSAPEEPKTIFDFLNKIQSLLGFLVLSAAGLLAVLLMKFISSKDASENRKLTAQLQQNMRLQQEEKAALPQETEPEKPELPEPPAFSGHELEAIRELKGSIVLSLSENSARLNDVLREWFDTGERGMYKAACLMDVMISAKRVLAEAHPGLNIDWGHAVPQSFQRNMAEIFANMSSMTPTFKIQILEEIYWDFISLKALGPSALSQPFQYVEAMPVNDVKNLLAGQQPRLRALAVLHMNEETMEDYMKRLPFEGKREIVEETLQMEKVLSTDIEAASETLKFAIKQKQDDTRTVSLKSMAPKLLNALSALDEIKLLRELGIKLSDGAASIKRSIPALAFLGEWPESLLKRVFVSAVNDEVMAYLRVMPELKDRILPLCPPRVQEIVGGDLSKPDLMSDEVKEKHLSALKLRLLQTVNRENINLEEIFPEKSAEGGLRAVS